MTKTSDLPRLADLAQLMLDHRLGHLRRAASELERSRMQLAALNETPAPTDLGPVTAEKVSLSYDRWADQRRADLNLIIARQTAAWLDARSEATTSFGRVQALQYVATRLKKKP